MRADILFAGLNKQRRVKREATGNLLTQVTTGLRVDHKVSNKEKDNNFKTLHG